jgi:hypothetical protein
MPIEAPVITTTLPETSTLLKFIDWGFRLALRLGKNFVSFTVRMKGPQRRQEFANDAEL